MLPKSYIVKSQMIGVRSGRDAIRDVILPIIRQVYNQNDFKTIIFGRIFTK